MKIFPDFIDNNIFPKKEKRFLSDEKELIDSFIIALTSNYKKSKYLGSSFSDDLKWDFCSEMISQSYNINNKKINIKFVKIYIDNKEYFYDYLDLVNGYIGHTKKEIETAKVLIGIRVLIYEENRFLKEFQLPILYYGKFIELKLKKKIKEKGFPNIIDFIKKI